MILYHTTDCGTSIAAATIALNKAVVLSKHCNHRSICIAAHSRNSFRAGVFSHIFSAAGMIAIAGGFGWPFKSVTVTLLTEIEGFEEPNDCPLIAAYVQQSWANVLIAGKISRAIFYLPRTEDELQMYLLQHPESKVMAEVRSRHSGVHGVLP